MNILYLFIYFSVVFCAIPISQSVTSKFKYLRDQKPIEEPVKLQSSHLQSVNDKVMKYNKLGSNYNLVVDQVKAHSAPEVYKTEPEVEKVTTSSSSDTVEPSVIASDYEIKSARTFINDFLKFKTQQLSAQSVGKEANPRLSTSIKNYDNALNHPYDLKFFTNKVIQETKEETDFPDYNFKKYGATGSGIPYSKNRLPEFSTINFDPKLNMEEFVNYLTKFEGFKAQDLRFLQNQDTGLDYGLDEIEEELNRIKDKERAERNIEIDGESLSSKTTVKWFMLSLATAFYLL